MQFRNKEFEWDKWELQNPNLLKSTLCIYFFFFKLPSAQKNILFGHWTSFLMGIKSSFLQYLNDE